MREYIKSPLSRLDSSGSINETALLGEPQFGFEYQADKNKLLYECQKRGRRVTFEEAVELVKRFQPLVKAESESGKPRYIPQEGWAPRKKFPKDLRESVARELGLANPEENKKVLFWTAIGTLLDKDFSTDAVIELKGPSGVDPSRYVRLDTTLYHGKKYEVEKNEDDLVKFGKSPDPEEKPREYQAFVDNIAGEIAAKLGVTAEVAEATR